MTRRAVLYLRLSESDDASTSIERQERDLRARCAAEGWSVVRVYTDDGLSGGKARAKAEAALADIAAGRADVLLSWKLDRWSRQGISAMAQLVDTLDAAPGSLFVAHMDGLTSDSPAWRLIGAVLAETARMELESIRLRARSSIATLRTSGRFAGGVVPYGYAVAPNPDGPGRVLVVDPREAAVVRFAVGRILAGDALAAVSRALNSAGTPSPRSRVRKAARDGLETAGEDPGKWTTTGLRKLLTGSPLLGRVTHHGDLVRGADGLPVTVWEPIVTPEEHWTLRALLEPHGNPRERAGRSRLLSGLVRCGLCGSRLYVGTSHGAQRYRCFDMSRGGLCPGASIKADTLEEYVTREALESVGGYVLSHTEATGPDPAALADVEAALARLAQELVDGDGAEDPAALLARMSLLKARRAELRQSSSRPVLHVLRDGPQWGEAFTSAESLDARRALLARVVASLELLPTTSGSRVVSEERVRLAWAV